MTTTTYDFRTSIPAPFSSYNSKNGFPRKANVVVEDGATSLWTRQQSGKWTGADLVMELPFTYGKVEVDLRVDQAHATKALAMLIYPAAGWPPELDFLEQGGFENWDRHKIACTAHYNQDNEMIHKALAISTTTPLTVSCDWQKDYIKFQAIRATESANASIANPGITTPLKLHLAYWPHHKTTLDPWPTAASRMQVSEVRMTLA